jgi:OmcA/MtrC family decaheme c-type cytochrome
MTTQYGAGNKVIYFSVDGSGVVKRRKVVDINKCNQRHIWLSMHGENRKRTEYCVLCHNPSNASSETPSVGIDLSVMVDSIHFGDNLAAARASYKIGGSDFTGVRYSAMSPQGNAGDTTNCEMCYVTRTEGVFPICKNPVNDPGALMDPAPATTAAWAACRGEVRDGTHVHSDRSEVRGELRYLPRHRGAVRRSQGSRGRVVSVTA